MCMFALKAQKSYPAKALVVDYANLPEAVPEFVFPEHFGMGAELDEVCAYAVGIIMSHVGQMR